MVRLIRKLADVLVPPGLPLAAIAAFALLPSLPLVGYVLAAATFAYQLAVHRWDGLGEYRLGRALTAAGLLLASLSGGAGIPGALAGVALIALISFEPRLQIALTAGRLDTANLAVNRAPVEAVINPRSAYALTTALGVGYLVTGVFGVSAWPVAVASLAVVGVFGAGTLLSWRWRRRHAHTGDAGVVAAVAAAEPRFAIHFAAPAGSQYQLLMWLPYFDDLPEDYVIILRDKAFLPVIAAATKTPVVVAPGVADVERILTDSIRAVFYVNNSMQNTQCVRFAHLTHVQLMHGDSDKPASYNPISAMYDRIFVAGQAGVDRYHNHGIDIPASRFRIVGHPQAAAVEVWESRRDTTRGPVALYAPTWTGLSSDVNFCSLPVAEKICAALIEHGATIIVRPHPYTRRNPAAARQLDALERMLAADAERSGRAHQYGRTTSAELSLIDCINAADVMVCDVSGAASDWLYSQRPFAVTDVTGLGDGLAAELPLAKAAYRVERDASNMGRVCTELLETDSLASERAKMKRYYLGDFDTDDYPQVFARAARDCYRSAAAPDETTPDETP